MTMMMMMMTSVPKLLVKPYVVSGLPLYCNKVCVMHNNLPVARLSSFCFLNSVQFLRSYRVAHTRRGVS